jgi:hypothetical protein
MTELKKSSWLVLVCAVVAAIALLFSGVRLFKSQQDGRRYLEIRKAVRQGRISDNEVRQDLGEEYQAYRKFVDSLPE